MALAYLNSKSGDRESPQKIEELKQHILSNGNIEFNPFNVFLNKEEPIRTNKYNIEIPPQLQIPELGISY